MNYMGYSVYASQSLPVQSRLTAGLRWRHHTDGWKCVGGEGWEEVGEGEVGM